MHFHSKLSLPSPLAQVRLLPLWLETMRILEGYRAGSYEAPLQ